METRTVSDIVRESEEQGQDSQWTPEVVVEEPQWVVVEEVETIWGKNVRGVKVRRIK